MNSRLLKKIEKYIIDYDIPVKMSDEIFYRDTYYCNIRNLMFTYDIIYSTQEDKVTDRRTNISYKEKHKFVPFLYKTKIINLGDNDMKFLKDIVDNRETTKIKLAKQTDEQKANKLLKDLIEELGI